MDQVFKLRVGFTTPLRLPFTGLARFNFAVV